MTQDAFLGTLRTMPASNELDDALEDGRRQGLLAYIAERPDATVADILASKAAGDVLKTLTFEEIWTALAGDSAGDGPQPRRPAAAKRSPQPKAKRPSPAKKRKTKAKPKAKPKSKESTGDGLNLRTAAARQEYQTAVLEFLQRAADKVSAPDLRAGVGGSEAQARSALKALEELGYVDHAGKTAATRYWAK